MFYIIYIAVIVFALYVIFHDRGEGENPGRKKSGRLSTPYRPENPGPSAPYRPENPGPVPQTPVRPEPKPAAPAPRVVKPVPARQAVPAIDPVVPDRQLSWSYLYTLEYDGSITGDVLETQITGMRYYCSLADLGPVNGVVLPEPSNPHDPHAQAVVRADGKKLGYIPRNALPEYENFNPDKRVCPFAGRVKVTRQGYMWADILVARPLSRDFVKEELSAYMEDDPD